jgi:hypothetical protein
VIAESPSLITPRKSTINLRVLLVLGALGLLLFIAGLGTLGSGDYHRYYQCGVRAFLHGQDPYACPDYYNAPPILLLLAPFGALPAPLDAWAWGAFVVACTLAAIILLFTTFGMLEQRSLLLIGLLILCPFTIALVIYQQASAQTLLLEAIALWLLVHRRYVGGAAVLALGVFKPHLLLILLPMLAPLPRKARVVGVAATGLLMIVLSWPYLDPFIYSIVQKSGEFRTEHATVALRELTAYFSAAGWWQLVSNALLIPPLLYCCYLSFRLWQARTLDLILVAKLLAAGLLWLPYNRMYDWVLAIPAYLVLWELYGRRWTPGMIGNIVLALIALPVSTATFLIAWPPEYAHLPISINPVPLIVLIVTLDRAARANPQYAQALRLPI